METRTFTQELVVRLRDKLNEPSGGRQHSSIITTYIYMFEMLILSEPDAFDWIYETFVEEPDNWFYKFHKSIRQGETYIGYEYKGIPQKLTLEQKIRLDELKDLDREAPDFTKLMSERLELRAIWYDDGVKQISGYLDGMLWELIHIDTENILYDLMGVILSNILIIDPKTKECGGNLSFTTEISNGFKTTRCHNCEAINTESLTSDMVCHQPIQRTLFSEDGKHWRKSRNQEWTTLQTKTI